MHLHPPTHTHLQVNSVRIGYVASIYGEDEPAGGTMRLVAPLAVRTSISSHFHGPLSAVGILICEYSTILCLGSTERILMPSLMVLSDGTLGFWLRTPHLHTLDNF